MAERWRDRLIHCATVYSRNKKIAGFRDQGPRGSVFPSARPHGSPARPGGKVDGWAGASPGGLFGKAA
jgi:hypothetical protein